MQFEVEQTTSHGRPVVRVTGELDLFTAPALEDAVAPLLTERPAAAAIDLTGTTFLDSSGARQLARLAKTAQATDVDLVLVCPKANRPVRMVLDLLDLQALVPVLDSLDRG